MNNTIKQDVPLGKCECFYPGQKEEILTGLDASIEKHRSILEHFGKYKDVYKREKIDVELLNSIQNAFIEEAEDTKDRVKMIPNCDKRF